MSIEHKGYTFRCDLHYEQELEVDARTERTAIEHARAEGWDVLYVRATRGVPRNKVARTVRLVFCAGCAHLVGVRCR